MILNFLFPDGRSALHAVATTLAVAISMSTVRAEFPAPGEWRHLMPSPTPNYVNGIAFGNGQFVAVGDFGFVATSSDGARWTQRDSGGPKEWPKDSEFGFPIIGIAYGGSNTWVAAGGDGRIYYSKDNATTWTSRKILDAEDNFFDEVRYANGRWIVAGAYGGVFTSSDAINWEPIPIKDGTSFWAIAHGQNQWVAVDEEGNLFASEDGTSWSEKASGLGFIDEIVYADGLWVAVGDNDFYSSTDLVSWTKQFEVPDREVTEGDGPVPFTFWSVKHANGMWVASGGVDIDAFGSEIAVSNDGINWDPAELDIAPFFVTDVAYGNGRWIGSSLGQFITLEEYETFSIWTPVNTANEFDVLPGLLAIGHHNDTIIASGKDGTILRSENGGRDWASIVVHNVEEPDWLNIAHYSPRLQKWFVGGDHGSMWTSDDDGRSWKAIATPSSGFEALAEASDLLVAVGRDWGIYTSPDGVTWTKRDSPVTGEGRFKDVAYADGTFIAVGDRETIVVSTDGISWEDESVSSIGNPGDLQEQLIGVASGVGGLTEVPNHWAVVGENEASWWRAPWGSWVPSNSGSGAGPLNSVHYYDSQWVAVGFPAGTFYTSQSGVFWDAGPSTLWPPGGSYFDMAYVDGRWFAVGEQLVGGIISYAGPEFPMPSEDRSILFSDPSSYTVEDTNDPVAFKGLTMPKTIGGEREIIYIAFNIQRNSPLGALDFTGLQLSRSADNKPRRHDLGIGNPGPSTKFGAFVENSPKTMFPDRDVPLDMAKHVILARLDFSTGDFSMVVDPASPIEIGTAEKHFGPSNPFSTILLRAGHQNTSYTYSRIAVGESPIAVLAFANGTDSGPSPELPKLRIVRSGDDYNLTWPKTPISYTLEASRDLSSFTPIRLGIQETPLVFKLKLDPSTTRINYYRLRE